MESAVTGIAMIDGFIAIVAENFVATVLQVGFGALIAVAVVRVKRMIDRRPVYRTWRRICENQSKVPIVISSIVFKEFEISITRGSAVLPPNITLVGLYDGLAVAELRSALSEAFPRCRFPICTDKNFNEIDGPFITIGGGSVNEVSRRVIASLKPTMKLDVVYPDHYFVDEGREVRPRRNQERRRSRDARDYRGLRCRGNGKEPVLTQREHRLALWYLAIRYVQRGQGARATEAEQCVFGDTAIPA